jgi:hypothetical protein
MNDLICINAAGEDQSFLSMRSRIAASLVVRDAF